MNVPDPNPRVTWRSGHKRTLDSGVHLTSCAVEKGSKEGCNRKGETTWRVSRDLGQQVECEDPTPSTIRRDEVWGPLFLFRESLKIRRERTKFLTSYKEKKERVTSLTIRVRLFWSKWQVIDKVFSLDRKGKPYIFLNYGEHNKYRKPQTTFLDSSCLQCKL